MNDHDHFYSFRFRHKTCKWSTLQRYTPWNEKQRERVCNKLIVPPVNINKAYHVFVFHVTREGSFLFSPASSWMRVSFLLRPLSEWFLLSKRDIIQSSLSFLVFSFLHDSLPPTNAFSRFLTSYLSLTHHASLYCIFQSPLANYFDRRAKNHGIKNEMNFTFCDEQDGSCKAVKAGRI